MSPVRGVVAMTQAGRRGDVLHSISALEWDLAIVTDEDVKAAKLRQLSKLKEELKTLKEVGE